MIVPKIAICPICGKRTYMRIQNGGYMYSYPIRIHCLNCHALIRGIFVMDSSVGPKGLTLFNAKVEDPYVNIDEPRQIEAEYLAEISGELVCKKISVFDGKICQNTPYLRATGYIDMQTRISQLKEYYHKMKEWNQWKSIPFQLLAENEMDYLPVALHNNMGTYIYKCDNYLKSLHCLQEVVRDESRNLFSSPDQDVLVIEIIVLLSGINHANLHDFVIRLGGVSELKEAYRKIIDIFSAFMEVYQYVLPAESYERYKKKIDDSIGISTCSVTDIKNFYMEAYETLLSLMHIPVCLDNILERGEYQQYNPVYCDYYNNNYNFKRKSNKFPDDYSRYFELNNGKKAELMCNSREKVQALLNVPVNRDLRNAFAHNTYKYDGINQIITAFDQKNSSKENLKTTLLDMAIDCIKIARSSVLMAEIILFILRIEEKEVHSIIHPRYYRNAERNKKCPCGSGKKYKKCCMQDLERLKLSIEKR